jgi:pyruvate formate lyase activating enzyme
MTTLAEQLARHTRESELCERLDGHRVRCLACAHRCPIPAGFAGVCQVRFNRGGKLYAPYGYVNAIQCDPIEKKPFFHVRPGSRALSFGMLGCDLHCGYCQNWLTSQALRDSRSSIDFIPIEPKKIVDSAILAGADAVISTYNEPLITAEWAVDVFRRAHQAGLLTGFVSNGNATPEVLRYLRPWVDLYKADLKSFSDRRYHELGGRLGPILEAIARIHDMGFWLEIVTLVVPGLNDSDAELESIARFIASISPDIPWHVTAFRREYNMMSGRDTPAATLLRAFEIGRNAGLHFVYAGNLPGAVGACEDTLCPECHTPVIRRHGFRIVESRVGETGVCPDCAASIPGVWSRPARAAG